MKRFWRYILDFLFPLICVECGREDFTLCADCLVKTEVRQIQECPYCHKKNALGRTCQDCLTDGAVLDGLICLWNYQKNGALAKLLYFYKYEGLPEYGKDLRVLFGREAADKLLMADYDLLTWVPMSRKKLRQRGFNQSKELALTLPGIKAVEILEKIRKTQAQMSLNREKRLVNLQNSFKVKVDWQDSLAGKTILVVDDIATTLATLEETARTLKLAGAVKVFGLVAARQKD